MCEKQKPLKSHYTKNEYAIARAFLKEHHAEEINLVEFNTWRATLYRLDNGEEWEEWEEYQSKLEAPEDDYNLSKVLNVPPS